MVRALKARNNMCYANCYLSLTSYFALSALSKRSYTFPGAVPQAFSAPLALRSEIFIFRAYRARVPAHPEGVLGHPGDGAHVPDLRTGRVQLHLDTRLDGGSRPMRARRCH